jgi:hypothetical protein
MKTEDYLLLSNICSHDFSEKNIKQLSKLLDSDDRVSEYYFLKEKDQRGRVQIKITADIDSAEKLDGIHSATKVSGLLYCSSAEHVINKKRSVERENKMIEESRLRAIKRREHEKKLVCFFRILIISFALS